MSYLQHSQNTKEYLEGKNSAIQEAFEEKNVVNPYDSSTKEWLDWQLGFESIKTETAEILSPIGLIPTLYDAQLGYYCDWNPMGFR